MWFMYEWNVRLGINVIAGYTSKQGYHSFEKRGGGRKTILNNSPHESKVVNESFESSRIEWIFFRIYFFSLRVYAHYIIRVQILTRKYALVHLWTVAMRLGLENDSCNSNYVIHYMFSYSN